MAERKHVETEAEHTPTEVEKAEANEAAVTRTTSTGTAKRGRRGRKAPERVEPKPFAWVNPDEQPEAHLDEVAGSEIEDVGDLEFHPGNFVGVSPDFLRKSSTSHGYPAWSDEEIKAEEDREDEIEALNKEREAERKATEEVEDKKAARRLRDLINGS